MRLSDMAEPEKARPQGQRVATSPPTLLLWYSFPSLKKSPHKPTQPPDFAKCNLNKYHTRKGTAIL